MVIFLFFTYFPLKAPIAKRGSRSRGRGQLSEFFLIPVCFYGPLEQENMLIILNFQKKFFLGWSTVHGHLFALGHNTIVEFCCWDPTLLTLVQRQLCQRQA